MSEEQVRKNISLLISEIVYLRKENGRGYCVDVKAMESETCDGRCDECQDRHYENMEEYLNNKYNI